MIPKVSFWNCLHELTNKTGYVRITDLGIARVWRPENSSDTSGTPGYMGNRLTNDSELNKL